MGTEKLQTNNQNTQHNIVFDGIDRHNNQYDYKCTKCGAYDWIASYGTLEQLDFFHTPCKGKHENN